MKLYNFKIRFQVKLGMTRFVNFRHPELVPQGYFLRSFRISLVPTVSVGMQTYTLPRRSMGARQNIIFTFEDVKDETKINIIAVDIRKTVKKFGKINSVLTLDKGTLEDFEARVRGKEVIKLK